MAGPLFPVKLNRTIQLRKLNAMDPEDMQQLISFARISETEQFVQSKNDALTKTSVRSVRNWYGQQVTELSKLNRSQNFECARLDRITASRKMAREKKSHQMAIHKTTLHTEPINCTDRLKLRRDGLVPKHKHKSHMRAQSVASNTLQVPGLTAHSSKSLSKPIPNSTLPNDEDTVNNFLPRIDITDLCDESYQLCQPRDQDDNITIPDIRSAFKSQDTPMEINKDTKTSEKILESPSKQMSILQQASRMKKDILGAPFDSYRIDKKTGDVVRQTQLYKRKDFTLPDYESSSNSSESCRADFAKCRSEEGRCGDAPYTSPGGAPNTTATATAACNTTSRPRLTPGSTQSRNTMLRKRYTEDVDRQEQRILDFMKDLDKLAAWDATSYIQSLRPKTPEKLRKSSSLAKPTLKHIDIFGKYYKSLLEGLDPNGEEAMKYCRYIRDVDAEGTVKTPRSCRSAKSIVF